MTGRLDPGAFAEGVIRYAPTAPGRHRGGLRYAFGQSTLQNWVGLVGQAATCDLEAFPSVVDFGTVAGGSSTERPVTLVNNGARACQVTALGMLNTPFALVSPPSLPFNVDPGQSADITVRFSPPAGPVQSFSDTFTVTSDEIGMGATNSVRLTANGGGTPVCEVEVSPTGARSVATDCSTLAPSMWASRRPSRFASATWVTPTVPWPAMP